MVVETSTPMHLPWSSVLLANRKPCGGITVAWEMVVNGKRVRVQWLRSVVAAEPPEGRELSTQAGNLICSLLISFTALLTAN